MNPKSERKNRKNDRIYLRKFSNYQLEFFYTRDMHELVKALNSDSSTCYVGSMAVLRDDLLNLIRIRKNNPVAFTIRIGNIKAGNNNPEKVSSSNVQTNQEERKAYMQTPKRDPSLDRLSLYTEKYSEMTDKEVVSELKNFVDKHSIDTLEKVQSLSLEEIISLIKKGKSDINSVSVVDLGLLYICRKRKITNRLLELKEKAQKERVAQEARQKINDNKSIQADNWDGEGIAFEDFVIKGDFRKCIFKHESILIKAKISLINRRGNILQKTIPAGFCPKCKSYFILKRDFDDISEYGIPLCQQFTENEFRMYITGWRREFKEHSIINQMGYNVNAKDDLSRVQRHAILALALDRNVYTRAELDNHIYKQIALRANNPIMENAIAKWEEDRKFIQEYKAGSTPIVGVKSITKRLIKKR